MVASPLLGHLATRQYHYRLSNNRHLTCDSTGYGNHGDYVFGWKDDSLQKIMDEECYVNCKTMRTQTIDQMNACSVENKVKEDIGDKDCRYYLCIWTQQLTFVHRDRSNSRPADANVKVKTSNLLSSAQFIFPPSRYVKT
jgi:hypothetical protein